MNFKSNRLIKFIVFLLTVLLGISIAFKLKDSNKKYQYVSLRTIYDYQKVLDKEKAEIKNLNSLIQNYRNKINEYERAKLKDGDIADLLKEEIKEYKKLAGFIDMQGPGIILIMDDASRPLYEGEDPNNLIVHNIDVLNIINDLKVAGAEAISINGQRVMSNTEIDCSGYTIKVNNEEYGMPIIIKAIGEPKQLEAAIKAPGTYGNLLKEIGLFIEVNTSVNIRIPKFSEEIIYKYLTVEEGD